MKTIKQFAGICLILFFTAIFTEGRTIGIRSGTRNPFLQQRYKRIEMILPVSGIPLLQTTQRNPNRNSILKSGDLAMQRLDNLVNQYWDAAADKWEPNFKQEYSYESNGNMFQVIYSSRDPWTNQWIATVKECFMYASKGKVSRFITYNWSIANNQWIADVKQELFYCQAGFLTGSSCFTWDQTANRWSVNYKMEYTTDPRGNISKTIVSKWDGTSSQWKNEQKDEYLYDSNGNLTLFITCYWSEGSGTWVNSFKDENKFDEKGKQLQALYYSWSDVTKWTAIYKDDFSYDIHNNLTRLVSSRRVESSGEWTAVYMAENIHNNSYSFCDLILPFTDDETRQYFCHQLDRITEYDMNSVTGKWNLSNRIDFNYSRQPITDLADYKTEPETPEVKVFPNPATEYVIVWCPFHQNQFEFTLVDVNGRKLVSAVVDNGDKIPLWGFESGVCFYEIKYGDKKENGKLIIR